VIPPLTTKIVVQSDFTMRRCREAGVLAGKLVSIPNTLPRREVPVEADRAVLDVARRRRTLLCVGQIAPFKGTHVAVDATLALLEKGRDVQLIIAGRVPTWPPEYAQYHARMRERIDQSGYADRFHFTGHVENVPALMKESYLLLAPYLGEESFGIVVLEAMSTGLPVVAFSLGAIPELIEHERSGFLCEGLETESLLQGIDFFWSDPAAWERARELSHRRFTQSDFQCSAEAFARSWRRLFSLDLPDRRQTDSAPGRGTTREELT